MGSKRHKGESSSSNPPYNVSLAKAEHRTKFLELDRRNILTTLFFCAHTTIVLNIRDQVIDFAETLGFAPFLNNLIPNDWLTTDSTFNNPR